MNILLVDDHRMTREELASIISAEDDLNVVAQAGSGEEGIRLVRQVHPDMVVMDIVMPGMSGIEAAQSILKEHPDMRILAVSNHSGNVMVKAVLQAGVRGYVRKDQAYEELLPAIRAVAEDKEYLGQRISE